MLNPQRRLPFPNLRNARDLGGCPTRDGQHTRWHSLLRADALHQLTPDGVQAVLAYGIRTVIDLRCVAGKDRTGMIAALLLALADAEPAAIVDDYVLSKGSQAGRLSRHGSGGCS